MLTPTSDQFESVRARIIGYSDATLSAVKEAIAEQLGYPAGSEDMDCLLATTFRLERCSYCGHWFDVADCANDDGAGMFECNQCHDQN